MRKTLLALVLLLFTGCGSAIHSLDRQRVAPGETFTIHGRRLTDDLDSPPRVPPVLDRCGETPLEVLEWHVDRQSGCVMDRNRSEYCSACRTGLNIPLDANNTASIDAAILAILTRYPPGW